MKSLNLSPLRLAALSLAFLPAPGAWALKAVPQPPASYVHNENVVSDEASRKLTALLGAFERSTGRQFAVGLFQSLDGDGLESYVNRVFKAWKPGSKKNDDGLLFCVFLKERRWRVEVGYGLEGTLTDLEAAEIASSEASPRFKAGDYDGGVTRAVEALAAKLGGGPSAPRPPARSRPRGLQPLGLLFLSAFFAFLALFIGGIFWILANVKGSRPRRGGESAGGGSSGADSESNDDSSDDSGFSGGGGDSGGGGASGGW